MEEKRHWHEMIWWDTIRIKFKDQNSKNSKFNS